MVRKTALLTTLLIIVITAAIGGMPEYPYTKRITEEEIPMPEIQYELPEVLIGEFVMVGFDCDHYITIFPNNKYILLNDVAAHLPLETYGHIVNKDNAWYFSPSFEPRSPYFYGLKEIHITDSGFFFYHDDYPVPAWPVRSMREESIPVPEHLASDITVIRRNSTQQYFVSGEERIDFNEIDNTFHGFYTHSLDIDNGIVRIIRRFHYLDTPEFGEANLKFIGFMEKTSESMDTVKGVIKFTNGIPYYYISEGTAEIELNNNGSIMITMLYSPPPEYINSRIREMPGLQFPATLVLEF
jgi:hypothetical protein